MLRHFAWIQRRWPNATIVADQYGAHTITVPGVPVEGYDRSEVTVTFVAPVGFPLACPLNFQTSAVRLSSGSMPPWTDWNDADDSVLWFHRVTHWDPQRDSLINYIGSILRRLHVSAQPVADRA